MHEFHKDTKQTLTEMMEELEEIKEENKILKRVMEQSLNEIKQDLKTVEADSSNPKKNLTPADRKHVGILQTMAQKLPWNKKDSKVATTVDLTIGQGDKKRFSNMIVKAFEQVTDASPSNTLSDPLLGAAIQQCKVLAEGGLRILKAEKHCVRLEIERSNESVLSFLGDCVSGMIAHVFKPLEKAIQQLPGCENYKQDVVISERDYSLTVAKIVERMEDTVTNIDIANFGGAEQQILREQTIGSPPAFTRKLPRNTEIDEGETLVLHVKYSGNPKPLVKWSHGAGEISNNCSSRTVGLLESESVLEIPNVTLDDSGVYTVRASNIHGVIETTCLVKGVPKSPEIEVTSPTPTTETEASDVEVEILSEQSQMSSEAERFTVFKDGEKQTCELPDPTDAETAEDFDMGITEASGDTKSPALPKLMFSNDIALQHRSTVTGICVLSEKYLVAVTDFSEVVLISKTPTQTPVISTLKISGGPHDVARIGENKIAVTRTNPGMIQYISISDSGTLKKEENIQVNGMCHGIEYCNDTLIVLFLNPGSVQVLNNKGDQIHCFSTDNDRNHLFRFPEYLTLSPDKSTIYVSDYGNNTVTALTMTGQVKAVVEDETYLQQPHGMTVDSDGNLYVCDYASHSVSLVCTDTGTVTPLIGKSDGLNYPYSVAYCNKTNKLYVGMSRGTLVINVYDISPQLLNTEEQN